MSKSLEFIKQRAGDKSCSTFYNRDFRTAEEMDVLQILKSMTGVDCGGRGCRFELDVKNEYGDEGHKVVNIIVDPNGDFDYFTSETCLFDGTLLFYTNTVTKALSKIITGQTYNSNCTKPKLTDTISYTVGNVITICEHDNKFAPQDKPWLTSRLTVMIPLRCEIGRNE